MTIPNYLTEIVGLRKKGVSLSNAHPQIPAYTEFALELHKVYANLHEASASTDRTSTLRAYSAHTDRLDKVVERLGRDMRILDGKVEDRPFYDAITEAVKNELKKTNGNGHLISEDEEVERMFVKCDEDAIGFVPAFEGAYNSNCKKAAVKKASKRHKK